MMRIWYGTLLIATVVLSGYLVAVLNRALPAIETAVYAQQAGIKNLKDTLERQNQMLVAIQAELKKNNATDAPPQKPQAPDKGKLAVDALRNSLEKMKEADAKKQQGDINTAIDLLKSVKQALWQAGDVLPAHKAALRPLMGPIDGIIGKWKQGDKSADTSKIALAVRTVLHKIDSKFDT